jgi:Methyltransferase FkbM domain
MKLLDFSRNEFSQCGEDGILEKIFKTMKIKKGTCVEFGAWDGKLFSNSYHLIANKGWRGVFIEASPEKFKDLQETYAGRPDVICLNSMVGFEAPQLLDGYLAATDLPGDFDLLSIDVDGNDYHIFETVKKFRPKVVVVEFNPSIPNHIRFIQEKNMQVNHGSSLLAVAELAKTKGYELICCTAWNAIFVDACYFPLFGISNNSLDALHTDTRMHTYLIQMYDGTLRVAGMTRMIWHNIAIDEARIQMLPIEMRVFGDRL